MFTARYGELSQERSALEAGATHLSNPSPVNWPPAKDWRCSVVAATDPVAGRQTAAARTPTTRRVSRIRPPGPALLPGAAAAPGRPLPSPWRAATYPPAL